MLLAPFSVPMTLIALSTSSCVTAPESAVPSASLARMVCTRRCLREDDAVEVVACSAVPRRVLCKAASDVSPASARPGYEPSAASSSEVALSASLRPVLPDLMTSADDILSRSPVG